MAKRLHRASPKTGERRSLHKISAVLAAAGFLNERGKPHPRIDLGAPPGSGALAFRTNWRATAAQTQRQAYVWCNCRRDEVREGSRRARSWCLRLRLDQHRPASPKRTGQRTRLSGVVDARAALLEHRRCHAARLAWHPGPTPSHRARTLVALHGQPPVDRQRKVFHRPLKDSETG